MDNEFQDFAGQFYSLKGNLISERKKNFSKILQHVSTTGQVEVYLQNLKPRNYLECLLRLEALIYFRRTSELMEILQQGNVIFINKIIKLEWFLREAFNDYDGKYLVNEFLPTLSFCVRKKLIKNILHLMDDKERIDEIFSALYERYGLWTTSNLLHYCSEEKIKSILQHEEVVLQPNQLIYIYNTNYELFLFYLNYHYETFRKEYSAEKLIRHVTCKNVMRAMDLYKSNKFISPKFGRRATKKILLNVKDTIVENFNEYKGILNNQTLIKKLVKTGQFYQIYYNIFPCKVSDISLYSDEFYLLKYYNKLKRWQLVSETFTKKINESLDELYKRFRDYYDFNKLLPDRNIIIKWAEVNFTSTDDEDYLRYYLPSTGIPILKDRINVTSHIPTRDNMVQLLIVNCSFNKDLTALEDVLKYINGKFKNESLPFQHNILELIDDEFMLHEFTENHWNQINERLRILRLQTKLDLWRYRSYLKNYLEFLCTNTKYYDEFLKEFIFDVISESSFGRFYCKKAEIEQKLLTRLIEIALPEIEKDKNSNKFKIELIKVVLDFNYACRNHIINLASVSELYCYLLSIFETKTDYTEQDIDLIKKCLQEKLRFPDTHLLSEVSEEKFVDVVVKSSLISKKFSFQHLITQSILQKKRSNFEQILAKKYFEELYEKYPEVKIVNWFMWNEPEFIAPYFPKIVTKLHKSMNYKMIRLFSHFNFDTIMINELKIPLSSDNHNNKDILMNGLRILLPTDDYIRLVKEHFLLQKEKLDLDDYNMTAIYNVQCKIAGKLHKVVEPYKMLDLVIKFCVGDYLQFSLPGLYGTFCKSSENSLPHYIKILFQRAVSVRKHALTLTCDLLPQSTAVTTLINTKYEDITSNKRLFSTRLQYLKKNPTQNMFDLVIANIKTVNKNDKESMNDLIAAEIPKKYRSFYVEKCWEFYETIHDTRTKQQCYLDKVLSKILLNNYFILELSTNFIIHVTNNYFVAPRLRLNNIDEFVALVLKKRFQEQEEFFQITFGVMAKMPRARLRKFLENLTENNDQNYKILLEKYWNATFKVRDNFYEHIFIKLWILDSENEDLLHIANDMVLYLNSMFDEYGIFVFEFCWEAFRGILFRKSNIQRLELCYNMIQVNANDFICFFALKIIELFQSNDEINKILEIVKKVNRPIVQIYYNDYLINNMPLEENEPVKYVKKFKRDGPIIKYDDFSFFSVFS